MIQSRISRHLKILKEAGFLRVERKGRWAYYSIRSPLDKFRQDILKEVSYLEMVMPFTFLVPDKLNDGDLQLVLVNKTDADPKKGFSPSYEFEMQRTHDATSMGTIRLRIGTTSKLFFPGHIGYEVKKQYRGHGYAARGCKLLLPFSKTHGLNEICLTVDPHNIPSLKTCDILGAIYIETVRIPQDHQMYIEGARYRRRYRLELNKVYNTVK